MTASRLCPDVCLGETRLLAVTNGKRPLGEACLFSYALVLMLLTR